MSPPTQKPLKSPKKHLQSWKNRLAGHSGADHPSKQDSPSRRATISGMSPQISQQRIRSSSWASLPPDNFHPIHVPTDKAYYAAPTGGYDPSQVMASSAPADGTSGTMTMSDWEFVLSDMDRGYSNIFTGIYGGKECGEDSGPFASLTAEYGQKPDSRGVPLAAPPGDVQGLSPEAWSATSGSDIPPNQDVVAQSVLSYSDESMGSAEDGVGYHDMRLSPEDQATLLDPFRAVMMPAVEDEVDDFGLGGWDRRLAV
ncbi:DNA-binding transcription factor cat8 [Aspergillus melleus]|uniref:DNA-binding transcription factor cat8 n=1 Tax=Aspergillus melleus TaxID=138277 RepID=UPI001E8CEB7E|nr:DNA-binding transcription factor cat8 [Aspergillus melleus]KAH8426275.1 DNA-binding transcription factor cat8 [Aspergillus melleus]